MDDLSIIDRFTETFTAYIDSGFGLLNGEVAYLTTILVAVDITLAGLFWSMGQDIDVLARLIRKTLYVGVFALLLNNWSLLSGIIFQSFTGLGLEATANRLSASDLLRPGFVANTGFQAAWPLLRHAGSVISFSNLLENTITALVLLFAWAVVVLAFFILAVQLLITIVEFKLTSLAGFVLVPFALWNKTAFLAERVLGNVIGAGVKMMVLAVIIGIGTTFFAEFTSALQGRDPTLTQAMSLVLGAIAMFGLGIFGPGIAAGLTAGAPQLGAGAAVGTVGGLVAGGLAATGLGFAALRMTGAGGMAALRAGTSLGSASSAAYGWVKESTGRGGIAAGAAGLAKAGTAVMAQKVRSSIVAATTTASASSPQAAPPAWAARLRGEQRRRAQAHMVTQAVKDGDRPSSPANPDLQERE